MHTGTRRDIKNPCEVRSTRLRLSSVSGSSQLSLKVSLAVTTTTTNHYTLPCPALPRPSLHWRLSVLPAARSLEQQCISCVREFIWDGASATNLELVVFSSFFPPKMSSSTFSLLSSSLFCFPASLSFSLSVFLSGRGACGPVGRGHIPSAWGFCQRLVPFCVMVLTERTPHLTPIELLGWAAGRPAQANAAPCSAW